MSGVLEEDGAQLAQYQEIANLPHLRETFRFDFSNPDIDLTDKSELSIRVASFCDWPTSTQPFAMYLAQHGFFYTGVRDIVTCCYCMIKIRASELWKNSDIRKSVCLKDNCPYTFNLEAHQVK